MTKFTVAISGGGIAGLCLAAELVKCKDIRVDVYEMSDKIEEIGADITLWGRVLEALNLMGLSNDCINSSPAPSSSNFSTASAMPFKLRGFRQPDGDFGCLPFRHALRLQRADLIRILLRRVPSRNIHLGKALSKYWQKDTAGPVLIQFSDGTRATCDVLVGSDGVRSATRTRMMCLEVETTGKKDYVRYTEPRWSGTIAYRSLVPTGRLAARNPNHSLLQSGQIYLGKNQHIIGHPVSKSTLNIAISVTDRWKEDTRWPVQSWSTYLDEDACKRKIVSRFRDWDSEVIEIVEAIDSSIALAIMDLDPLPFYAKGHVVLIGDAAHAAVPYLGASAAFAIEDAFVLSRILGAASTTRALLPLALEAYEAVRRPYGNKLILDARLTLREFQYNGPHGNDMKYVKEAIQRAFEESMGIGESGPEADANRAIFWMEVRNRTFGIR